MSEERSGDSTQRPPVDKEAKEAKKAGVFTRLVNRYNIDVDPSLVKHVSILAGSQIMLNLGISQMIPVMPMFAAKMGGHLGATGIGLILSAPSAATLLLNFPLGRLADTVGRKPLMWCGTALTAIGTTTTGFVTSLESLLACRLLVGAGAASSMTGSGAYMADLSDRAPAHRAKIMGIHQAMVGSVWVIGPAVGGWLAETYGYRNSFVIAGVCAALCSAGYTQLPETLKQPKVTQHSQQDGGFKEWRQNVGRLLSSPDQQGLIALACEHPIRYSCFTTAVALHASNVAGAGPKELGMMFTALALSQGVGMPFGSWLADRIKGPKKSVVVPAGLISTFSFASLAFATSQVHLLAAMGVMGFCAGFKHPAVGAVTAEVTTPSERGQAMSLQRQAGSMLSLIGPISMGVISDLTNSPTAILTGATLMGICNLAYLILVPNKTSFLNSTNDSSADNVKDAKKNSK
eukprot:CAMPEP_0167765852 /NCGR_PEP_ID=MMETSP0110_2-20121227/14959_1 /TAXON_ID=629695 /ORGANISM="Gymnochlora sp., Strain CCMP2014" /LENGTH=460 /DNA_ID=CAMNT_0007653695 /DNA_START=87 /DNA_END=1469 /DNA_ORIENTATION=-